MEDYIPKIEALEQELSLLNIEDIRKEKIRTELGVDLTIDPSLLFKKYMWAWPTVKLLYYLNDMALPRYDLYEEYRGLQDVMKQRPDWLCINTYCYVYKPIVRELGWKKDEIIKHLLKLHFIEDEVSNQREKLVFKV